MSAQFFSSIIEDEKVVFGVKEETLKSAAKDVAKSYSRNSLDKGSTYLDYNIPSNRCAYLYKYGAIHTALVAKYFRKLVKVRAVKNLLCKLKDLKIVCLGGGPGTDVIGIFKALSLFPAFQKKIISVTILDICGGWRNSFKRIITNLCIGEVKNVPSTFIDLDNFKAELISVDLLSPLPSNVIERLSDADIVCMVKFVSAILGKPTALKALQVIGEKLKLNAVVLFIDNFQGSVSKPVEDISNRAGLQIVLGPLHERFPDKKGKEKSMGYKFQSSRGKEKIFGCLPLFCTKVSVIGCIKNRKFSCDDLKAGKFNPVNSACEDDGWNTESETEENIPSIKKVEAHHMTANDMVQKHIHHKYTQTKEECFNATSFAHTVNDLNSLFICLNRLFEVVNEWKEHTDKTCCCNCSH